VDTTSRNILIASGQRWERALAIMLIFLLLLALLLVNVLDVTIIYNVSWLVRLLDITFIFVMCFVAAYLAARLFTGTGRTQLPFLGGGLLVFGLANLVSAIMISQPNVDVTVHGTGSLFSAILFLVGAFIAVGWSSRPGKARLSTAAFIYSVGILFVVLMLVLSAQDITPAFLAADKGNTLLREIVLDTAAGLFAISGFILLGIYFRSWTAFLYWFGLGLLLISFGLVTVNYAGTAGDAMTWLGRGAQYLAGIYFLIGAVATIREPASTGSRFVEVENTMLPESDQAYRLLFDSAGDAIIALSPEGRIVLWNASSERMFGYSAKEAEGAFLKDLVIPERYAKDFGEWLKVIEEGSPRNPGEFVFKRNDGQEMPVEASLSSGTSPLTPAKALVVRDITERRKAEQLRDEFIGMVSHELRTRLTEVTGALYTSLSEELPVEEKQQLLHDALAGTEMLNQILDNLLELSRAQANHLTLTIQPVNMLEAAAGVVIRLQYKSAGHRFDIDIPPGLTVQADPVRLELILRNLVDNAIKYSPSGGQVTIFAKQDGENLVAGVSDQGPGIPPEEQGKLFMRFSRLEQSVRSGAGGIGLGLSVCRTLVEAHGGRIWVESQPGQGSTFYFTVPIDAKPDAAGNTPG
jgi:PAS domain S-box-containing protein